MPKFMVAFFVSIFLLGSSVGYGFGAGFKSLAPHSSSPITPASQVNIILVRVNDRSLDHPQLISIWGLFISRTEFPSLIMKHIYPEQGSDESSKIGQAFSLTAGKQPSANFTDALNSLELPSAQIMLVDDLLLPDWISALSGPSILETSALPAPGTNLFLAQQLDQELFTKACGAVDNRSKHGSLASANSRQEPSPLDKPNSSDNLQQWKGLVTSLHFASCEALVGP